MVCVGFLTAEVTLSREQPGLSHLRSDWVLALPAAVWGGHTVTGACVYNILLRYYNVQMTQIEDKVGQW